MLTPDERKDLDFEKIGPILESLVNSDRVSAEESHAIDLCARAAVDLLSMQHEEQMREFYSRPNIRRIQAEKIDQWLTVNQGTAAGKPVLTHGRWYVTSYTPEGKHQLSPIDPPWPGFPDDTN